MTDQPELPKYGERRPRPQYGEYATEQEQAKIIADSLPPVSPLLMPPVLSTPAPSPPIVPSSPAPSPPAVTGTRRAPGAANRVPDTSTTAVGRPPRRWDMILTAALLGYAIINVITQLLARDTLATIATQFFVAQGIGVYTPTGLTTTLGTTLNVITLAVFVATVLVTTWMLRHGRVAFWVPIAGGVLSTVVALVFVVILLQSDPAFTAYLDGLRR